jgi:hypothetical protein
VTQLIELVESSAVGYSLDSGDVGTEVEESPLLRAVTRQQLVKMLPTGSLSM